MLLLESCSDYFSLGLIPLAVWSIVVNILLYFPNGESSYASNNQLTNYVWYFQGICFGGIMILIIATVLLLVDNYKCCTSCCLGRTGQKAKYLRLGSPVFAFLGLLFSGYSLIISSLGLVQGPFCKTSIAWEYPFINTAGGYLTEFSTWSQCSEPANVVEWNVILFSILIALSALQVIFCLFKAVYDIKVIFCGTHSVIVQPEEI
ncbi:transmembrane 4 L6 family member 18 [Spea bombifrons]|uniref:transmembrane 4 L6 family member 18 n=1 Tax=Spea bombifrons TaxID=233779 RepID=UPI002349ABA7|nr:transmembrane 4 L6 family member 18 [Spea bombifrons]